MPWSAKYGRLLEDDDVRRWHGNLAASSAVTAEVYLRTLGFYCELEKTTPHHCVMEQGILSGGLAAVGGLKGRVRHA